MPLSKRATPAVVAPRPAPVRGFGPGRRGVQLVLGLLAYSASMAMMLHAGLGAMPWDVLSQGLVRTTGLSFGVVTGIISVVVLLAWVPLRQRPGIGTVANVVLLSVTIDPWLALLEAAAPSPGTPARVALAVGGIVLNGVATAAYVGVRLGPGPRDGLLTGLVARTGRSVRLVKTLIELTVVAAGWVLGGTVGWVTVVYALGVGVVVQVSARVLAPYGLSAGSRRRSGR
ncbi:hypothetical protein [Isoptericola sp. BMS4]|uniref:membrane protein YczE n=1 Tax=Isoptericola sp. BMS4 TaxID=2527875 RepID=UPI001F10AFC1|nr:hypothetical protein [Isoptericola sp. BMS4]